MPLSSGLKAFFAKMGKAGKRVKTRVRHDSRRLTQPQSEVLRDRASRAQRFKDVRDKRYERFETEANRVPTSFIGDSRGTYVGRNTTQEAMVKDIAAKAARSDQQASHKLSDQEFYTGELLKRRKNVKRAAVGTAVAGTAAGGAYYAHRRRKVRRTNESM